MQLLELFICLFEFQRRGEMLTKRPGCKQVFGNFSRLGERDDWVAADRNSLPMIAMTAVQKKRAGSTLGDTQTKAGQGRVPIDDVALFRRLERPQRDICTKNRRHNCSP